MPEWALLMLVERYPHPVAIARRVDAKTLHIGLRRLEARGLVARRGGLHRLTARGVRALVFTRMLRRVTASEAATRLGDEVQRELRERCL